MFTNHILFSGLSEPELLTLKSHMVTKDFGKNEIIYLQDDEIKHIYLVRSGWVKLFSETVDGEESIIDILTTNHAFGYQSVMEGTKISHSAEAIEKSTIIMIPLSKVRELLSSSSVFSMNMLKLLTMKQKFRDREVEHLSLQNSPQRIGCFLLRLCNSDDNMNVDIDLPYDKSLIASRLGMKAETFSRALHKLKDEAGVHVKGGSVNISSVAKLSEYCCGSCSSSFPCEDVAEEAI